MRTERLRRKKQKRKVFLLSLLSIILICISFIFFQETYSKGATKTIGSEDNGKETPITSDNESKEQNSPSDSNNENNSNDEKPSNNQKENEQNEPPNNQSSDENNSVDQDDENNEATNNTNSEEKENPNNIGNNEGNLPTKPDGKVIYLTFDDGPEQFTVDIMDLLDKYNAKATFFMLEPNMRRFPEIVKEMVNRGHQVALHSVTHDKNKFYSSKYSVVSEMTKSQQTLEKITGLKSPLIRTPYGSVPHMTTEYRRAVEEAGFIMWDWNIDSRDWAMTDGSYINNTIQQIENFNRDEPMVVLMHDRVTTLNHLEKLLIYLSEQGYKMEALTWDMAPVQFNH